MDIRGCNCIRRRKSFGRKRTFLILSRGGEGKRVIRKSGRGKQSRGGKL
jgi:hypothetical protein